MASLDPETELRGESVKLRSLVIDVASAAASDAISKNLELVVSGRCYERSEHRYQAVRCARNIFCWS